MPVDVSEERLARLALRLREGPLPPASDFTRSREEPFWPPRGAPWALAFFFTAVKHLFGLWDEESGRFVSAVRGSVDGWAAEGDEYVLMALAREAQEDPDFLLPATQASLDRARLERAFRDDRGRCPVPLLESHLELAREYGRTLLDLKWTPKKILEEVRSAVPDSAARPILHRFVELVSQLPGYREDPLQRKTFYLAAVLAGRPEKFLDAGAGPWPPILDRHMLRVALRWGAVGVMDPEIQERLAEARAVPPPVEEQVRLAAYDAFARLLSDAGRSAPDTLSFFRGARSWCPEDREPDCRACFFHEACARRTELKSPVLRTTAY